MSDPLDGVARALERLPEGTVHGRVGDRRYIATKSCFNSGRSVKLVAEETAGGDYISLNFYTLAGSMRLRPCEMPADKVIAFVLAFRPDQDAG